jgi:hypothetical protein
MREVAQSRDPRRRPRKSRSPKSSSTIISRRDQSVPLLRSRRAETLARRWWCVVEVVGSRKKHVRRSNTKLATGGRRESPHLRCLYRLLKATTIIVRSPVSFAATGQPMVLGHIQRRDFMTPLGSAAAWPRAARAGARGVRPVGRCSRLSAMFPTAME